MRILSSFVVSLISILDISIAVFLLFMIALYNFRIKKAGTYSRILKQKYLLTSIVQTYDTDPVFQIPSPGWDTGDGLLFWRRG